jgi:hypothetical protein
MAGMHPFRKSSTALVLAAAALLPAAAAHAAPPAPEVPIDIAVPDGHKPFLVGAATGVQIYPCQSTGAGYAWGPSTPRATLVDEQGKAIVEHFGGPSWQAKDGSLVVARRDSGVTVDTTAIPWLRLAVTSESSSPDGDRLAATTYIQRTATTGGLPPAAADCNAGTVGAKVEVPYTADYTFWKRLSDG